MHKTVNKVRKINLVKNLFKLNYLKTV